MLNDIKYLQEFLDKTENGLYSLADVDSARESLERLAKREEVIHDAADVILSALTKD